MTEIKLNLPKLSQENQEKPEDKARKAIQHYYTPLAAAITLIAIANKIPILTANSKTITRQLQNALFPSSNPTAINTSLFDPSIPLLAFLTIYGLLFFAIRYLIKQFLNAITTTFTNHLVQEIDSRLDDRIRENLEEKTSYLIAQLHPPVPIHGISGDPCPLGGAYYPHSRATNDRSIYTQVFSTGEILPHIKDNANKPQKEVWVLDPPETDDTYRPVDLMLEFEQERARILADQQN